MSLGAFQYIKAKGAIKDIGRVLGIPFEVTNQITKEFNDETIEQVLELGLLDEYKNQYPELFVYAEKLSGLPKSFSAHPCGKVIAMNEVITYTATDTNDDGLVVLQGDMHTADDLGLIKADFLGLRTVDVIYDTLETIGKDYNYIAPHNINTKDVLVYTNFRQGNTAGIFQFESAGMKDTLRKIECKNINDLIVANALYRPGSMKFIDNYVNRKKGTEEFEYLHPDLKPILENTYGVIVFQEQLIEIGRLAKLPNPDLLRKATAKKKADLLDKIRPELYDGLQKRGWSKEQFDKLWDMMIDFASYSFNKAHAAAYSLVAYICMYLKTYHPKEFLCSWINSVSDNTKKIAECVKEAHRMNIKVYHGKYNDCAPHTTLYKDGIILGTDTIKFCNSKVSTELMSLPKCSTYIEILDNIASKQIQSDQFLMLVKLNFFSEFGTSKKLIAFTNVYNGVKKGQKTLLPSFRTCKQISKAKIDSYSEYGITEFLIKKYSSKETASQYREIDNIGLLKEVFNNIPNKDMTVIESIKFEKEYLDYVEYTNSKVPKTFYVVMDMKFYSDKSKPYLVLRNISTGEEMKTKIKNRNTFQSNPFEVFSVLNINGFTWDFKKKNVDGKWISLDEREPILEKYEVVKG